jgi:polyhydroxybutyrate depolymerase
MHRAWLASLVSLLALGALGCASSSSSAPAGGAVDAGADAPSSDASTPIEDWVYGGDRPVNLFKFPDGADPKKPLPLVMVLHGYGASGIVQSAYFGLTKLVNDKQFLLIAPDGTPDKGAKRFWNAVDACCDFDKTRVDDVKYLTGLVEEVATKWAVDRKRIYLVGHSNGGAMSYRLSCDAAETFAAAFVLAPLFYGDAAKCAPKAPVSIRHVHGTADETVAYEGNGAAPGSLVANYPAATKVVETWAKYNGCSPTPDTSAAPLDLDTALPGAETTITSYPGCKNGAATELLTIAGGGHIPMNFPPDLPNQIWAWLSAHPKP